MRTSSAILAILAVPAVMACPPRHGHGHGHGTRPKSSTAASVIESTATPTTVLEPISSATSTPTSSPTASTSPEVPDVPDVPNVGAKAVTGTSTFYGGNLSGGTCSFTTYTLPSGVYGTAFSGSAWNSAAQCGACMKVTANGKSIIAMVVDKCPECTEGHLDLFENAFDVLSPASSDPLSTSYAWVDCPIASPLVLRNKSGTSPYWFSMQVVNASEPVAALEVSTDGGATWAPTTRRDYNFFENPAGFGTDAVAVRVTARSGRTVVVKGVSVASDSQVTAGSNF